MLLCGTVGIVYCAQEETLDETATARRRAAGPAWIQSLVVAEERFHPSFSPLGVRCLQPVSLRRFDPPGNPDCRPSSGGEDDGPLSVGATAAGARDRSP